jgi:hypothetical protein
MRRPTCEAKEVRLEVFPLFLLVSVWEQNEVISKVKVVQLFPDGPSIVYLINQWMVRRGMNRGGG